MPISRMLSHALRSISSRGSPMFSSANATSSSTVREAPVSWSNGFSNT